MIRRIVYLQCDRCHAVTNDAEDGESSTARECRSAAKADGWKRRHGLDLCPDCAGRKGRWPE